MVKENNDNKKKKNEKPKIKKSYLPADPNFFEHVTPCILFFWPKNPLPKEYVVHI